MEGRKEVKKGIGERENGGHIIEGRKGEEEKEKEGEVRKSYVRDVI